MRHGILIYRLQFQLFTGCGVCTLDALALFFCDALALLFFLEPLSVPCNLPRNGFILFLAPLREGLCLLGP